ncbi:MAG: HAMP domain-containing sensor histidine kinase [Oscillospiraceae bacterium]
MRKSIFYKYFCACFALILCSIIFVGITFMFFSTKFYREEKLNNLHSSLEKVSYTINNYRQGNHLNKKDINIVLKSISDNVNSTIFITDVNGKTLYCTQDECPHYNYIVSPKILNEILENGNYAELGKLSGIYNSPFYTSGTDLKNDDKQVIGFVFISCAESFLTYGLEQGLFKTFILSASFIILLSFLIIYFVSIKMLNPFKDMLSVAQKIGKGDFTARAKVTTIDEVGQLAMALNNMASSLSNIDSSRRSFLANVSHELKTPMTTIGGFIDGILDGTIPQEQHRHYLEIVSQEIKRLSALVKTMLNLSKIEAGEMQINREKLDIIDTICQVLFTFETKIEEKNLDIRGLDHPKVFINADANLIHQVVYNLIENAVKFVNVNISNLLFTKKIIKIIFL